MVKSYEYNKEIEEAIKFLVFAIQKTGHNPKPVILHSVRVGLHLYNLGYSKDTVVAAILHDVIEDSNIKAEEIESKFGERVAKLVKALTFDESIKDKTERYKENFERCHQAGKDALIIRAADFLDNTDYYNLAPTSEMTRWLLKKLKYFIDKSKSKLEDEPLYKELVEKYEKLTEIFHSP